MGHSHDRAGDWVYHCLLLLGPHSVRWQRWQGIGIHAAADKLFTKPWHCGSRRISLNCRSYEQARPSCRNDHLITPKLAISSWARQSNQLSRPHALAKDEKPVPPLPIDARQTTARDQARALSEMADTAALDSARCQSSGAALGSQAYKGCRALLGDKMSIEKDVPPDTGYARTRGN